MDFFLPSTVDGSFSPLPFITFDRTVSCTLRSGRAPHRGPRLRPAGGSTVPSVFVEAVLVPWSVFSFFFLVLKAAFCGGKYTSEHEVQIVHSRPVDGYLSKLKCH